MNQKCLPERSDVPERKRRRKKRRMTLPVLIVAVFLVLPALTFLLWCYGYMQAEMMSNEPSHHLGISWAIQKANTESMSDDIPTELQELLERNPETAEFVRQYPELHNKEQKIDLSDEAASDTVPHLLQWDTRWGYRSYGSGMLCCTGCGPTCLSMVALYLTNNSNYDPYTVAKYAQDEGYYVNGQGTSWDLMSRGCEKFGLSAEVLPLDENRMKKALDEGKPIICSMRAGDFTDSGHYIVLTGYTRKGFTVNDPNSVSKSEKIWSYDTIEWQIRNLWAFSPAGR